MNKKLMKTLACLTSITALGSTVAVTTTSCGSSGSSPDVVKSISCDAEVQSVNVLETEVFDIKTDFSNSVKTNLGDIIPLKNLLFTCDGLPTELTFDSSTGEISGRILNPTTYTGLTIHITATIGKETFECDTNTFDIKINDVTPVPANALSLSEDGTTLEGFNPDFDFTEEFNAITVPATVTTIAGNAFYNPSTEETKIPASIKLLKFADGQNITNICAQAFWKSPLTFLDLSTVNITTVPQYTFAYSEQLTNVILPSGLTIIKNWAFKECPKLYSLNLSQTKVTNICAEAFLGCESLPSVVLPDTVTEINADAFSGCNNITSITLSKSLTTLNEGAFSNIHSFYSVDLNGNKNFSRVTNLGDNNTVICAGDGNDKEWTESTVVAGGLACGEIVIPNSFSSIAQKAFEASSISSVDLTNTNITTIPSLAFMKCHVLETVKLPKHVEKIEDFSFGDCSSLKEVVLDPSNTNFCFVNNLGKNGHALVKGQTPTWTETTRTAGSLVWGDIEIPSTFTTIGEYSFQYSPIRSVKFPAGLTTLGSSAFIYCNSLTEIDLSGCNHLSAVSDQCFAKNTNLSSVILPGNVTTLMSHTFNGDHSLRIITWNDLPNAPTVGENCFYNLPNVGKLYYNSDFDLLAFLKTNGLPETWTKG